MSSSPDLRVIPGGRAAGPRVGILRGLTTSDQPVRTDPRAAISGTPAAVADVRREAEEAGFAEGYAAGMAAARAAHEEQVAAYVQGCATTLTALDAALADLRAHEAVGLQQVADQTAALALEIAEVVLAREVASAADPGRDAIARAIGLVPDEGDVIVRMHPADLARLADVEDLLPGRAVGLVPDPAVGAGGCIVQVGATRIDAQIATALDRVVEVLR
jgi:flagellar assembly protein FliH